MKKIILIMCLIMISPFALKAQSSGTNERFAYIGYVDNEPVLYLLDPASFKLDLKEFPEGSNESIKDVFVSPQGHWLLLQIDTPENRWLLWHPGDNRVIDLRINQSIIERPYTMSQDVQSLAWSLDEHFIAFNSAIEMGYDVLIYDIVNDTVSIITPSENAQLHLAWSADSRFLATTGIRCEDDKCQPTTLDIYDTSIAEYTAHIEIDQGSQRIMALANTCNLQWSPNSDAVSYMHQCDETFLITPFDIFVQFLSPLSDSSTSFLPTDIPLSDLIFKARNDYTWLSSTTLVIGVVQGKTQITFDETPASSVATHQTYLYNALEGTLTSLFPYATTDWTLSNAGYLAYIDYTHSENSIVAASARLIIAHFENNQMTPIGSFKAGCELKWNLSGTMLAYVEGERHGVNICTREFSTLHFINAATNEDVIYNLAGQAGLALGWVSLEPPEQ